MPMRPMTTTVTTPSIYALGTVTTVVSLAVMALAVALAGWLGRRASGKAA